MENSQYFLGEIKIDDNQKLIVVDLLSGSSYLITSFQNASDFTLSQIVKFTLCKNSPDTINPLALNNSIKACLYKIAAEKNLNPFFSPIIQSEVTKILETPDIDDPLLIDLEDFPFCTIDGVDTRD